MLDHLSDIGNIDELEWSAFSEVAAWMIDREHGVRLRDSEYGAEKNASLLDGKYTKRRRDNINNMVNGFQL